MMATKLIECIPNFSDGRRPEILSQILGSITSGGQIGLLNWSSDVDHNRSVVTFVGKAESVADAAFRAIATAARNIDLSSHHGVHPRVGATDVVPFVPLEGTSMEECVQLARQVGQRVGAELSLPVYLYEYAAIRPERTRLEDVRRGGYEALRTRIKSDPRWQPDYGPSELGSAGAVIIGARHLLIAFNVYLSTSDSAIAKQIAVQIRESSGGLPSVKAIGVLVNGLAQVSLNLTDFRRTSLFVVLERIHEAARLHGTAIQRTELIGLIPQAALQPPSPYMTPIAEQQILEVQLASVSR
ncbi:MAG TPA: glutamate formimidoyltransferase [Aggregatilineales bacterium]|nr:glutamate formimidoyltransferase [Aggregatilineales bacterium]